MAVNLNDTRNATERGWGQMYDPDKPSRAGEMVPLELDDRIYWVGGVHPGLQELLRMLVQECDQRGYKFDPSPQQQWGFAWRNIRGSDKPSNHSAGTAIDVNSAFNWLGRDDGGDIPRWMKNLFNEYGFRWGGDYSGRKDPMHFEFMGTREDARDLTERARGALEDAMFEKWKAGWDAHEAGVAFSDSWDVEKRAGWRDRARVILDAMSTPGPHTHPHKHVVPATEVAQRNTGLEVPEV